MDAPRFLVFDVNGTLSDLTAAGPLFATAGHALEESAATILDGFAHCRRIPMSCPGSPGSRRTVTAWSH